MLPAIAATHGNTIIIWKWSTIVVNDECPFEVTMQISNVKYVIEQYYIGSVQSGDRISWGYALQCYYGGIYIEEQTFGSQLILMFYL